MRTPSLREDIKKETALKGPAEPEGTKEEAAEVGGRDGLRGLAARRARAYDEVYVRTRVRPITVESYEAQNRWFLDPGVKSGGNINGNELTFAFDRMGLDRLGGRCILDLCCGAGRSSVYFALKGGRVWACDRSMQAIQVAAASSEASGTADRVCPAVMDVQELAYPSGFFDVVFCQSALHILVDYPACARELARIVRPGGRVIFCEEALAHNPLFEAVRWVRRQKYRDCGGRTLSYVDLRRFGEPFDEYEVFHFNLFLQAKQFLGEWARRRWIKRVLRVLEHVDGVLLKRCPPLRRFCGKVVVEYRMHGRRAEERER